MIGPPWLGASASLTLRGTTASKTRSPVPAPRSSIPDPAITPALASALLFVDNTAPFAIFRICPTMAICMPRT